MKHQKRFPYPSPPKGARTHLCFCFSFVILHSNVRLSSFSFFLFHSTFDIGRWMFDVNFFSVLSVVWFYSMRKKWTMEDFPPPIHIQFLFKALYISRSGTLGKSNTPFVTSSVLSPPPSSSPARVISNSPTSLSVLEVMVSVPLWLIYVFPSSIFM